MAAKIVLDQHDDQRRCEHPGQCFEPIAGRDGVANRFHDVVGGEDNEMKRKAEPESAGLVRFYVDDLGKELFQYEIVGRLCETASDTDALQFILSFCSTR